MVWDTSIAHAQSRRWFQDTILSIQMKNKKKKKEEEEEETKKKKNEKNLKEEESLKPCSYE